MQQLLMWVPVADDWSLVPDDWSRRESTLMKAIAVMVITEMQGTPWFFGAIGLEARWRASAGACVLTKSFLRRASFSLPKASRLPA